MSATLIGNARVFDGERVTDANAVLVRGGLIAEVGRDLEPSPASGAAAVDGRGGTLLPGLIDCHVHARLVNLEQALAFGVTTELDMGSQPAVVAELRAAAARRRDVADIRSPLRMLGSGNRASRLMHLPTAASPDEVRALVAARVAERADYIKVVLDLGGDASQLSSDTLRTLVEAAHAHGKLVLAHAESAAAARQLLAAGGDALAHVLGDLDADDPDFVGSLVRGGRFVVPTLRVSALACGGGQGDDVRRELLAHPCLGPYLEPRTRAIWARDLPRVGRLDFAGALRTTRALHAAGVPILAGTDAAPGIPAGMEPAWWLAGHGLALHHELALLVQAGLTASEALAAATSLPARCFGLADRGRIAPGLRADLLLVDGDPTSDIRAAREIAAVWRAGARLDREGYRERLAVR